VVQASPSVSVEPLRLLVNLGPPEQGEAIAEAVQDTEEDPRQEVNVDRLKRVEEARGGQPAGRSTGCARNRVWGF